MFKGKFVYCDWCGGKINNILMLHIDLWAAISDKRIDDIMCIPCIETKLGHEPTERDCRKPWWPYQLEQTADGWSKNMPSI